MHIAPTELFTILADCSGSRELADLDAEALHTEFDELGLDSLAVLESVARIRRDHGVDLPEDEVVGLRTPEALLDRLNQVEDCDAGGAGPEPSLSVVVVGAGPVGLTLACELAGYGVDAVVLERLGDPETMVKAGSIGPLAVALLRRRGLADELDWAERDTIARYQAMVGDSEAPDEPVVPKEHLAGLEKVEQADASLRRMRVEQPELVRILLRRAGELGVRVAWAHEVVALEQDDQKVRVMTTTPEGERRFHAAYVVGCDGGDSAVRGLAGIELSGTEPTLVGRQGVVELAGSVAPGFHHSSRGLLAWGLGVNRVATVEFGEPSGTDAEPLTAEELEASVRRVSGSDVSVARLDTGGRFTDLAYQAATYRSGRVFLAGDAAHLHAPFGGQGLNTGVSDAANLGWKLAGALQGWLPEGVLGTYQSERYPVGSRLLANIRAQTALMRTDPHSSALRGLVDRMMDLPEARRFVGAVLSGTDAGYDLGGGHPAVGGFCPEFELTATGSAPAGLAALFSGGRGLLLDLADDSGVRTIAARWSDRVDVQTAKTDREDLAAVLVRPDGYVAWAVAPGKPVDPRSLVRALIRWFGISRAAVPTGGGRGAGGGDRSVTTSEGEE